MYQKNDKINMLMKGAIQQGAQVVYKGENKSYSLAKGKYKKVFPHLDPTQSMKLIKVIGFLAMGILTHNDKLLTKVLFKD